MVLLAFVCNADTPEKLHEVFQVYAKWIDGADRGRERDKINAAQRMAA